MLRIAVRYIIRSVLVIAIFAGGIVGGYLAVDRLIIKADGPHDTERMVAWPSPAAMITIRSASCGPSALMMSLSTAR